MRRFHRLTWAWVLAGSALLVASAFAAAPPETNCIEQPPQTVVEGPY